MVKIAVCDDEYLSIKKNTDYIRAYGSEKNISISIDEYESGEELLRSKKPYDLIFLDIEMGEVNGIDTAEKIRQTDTHVQIVYITNYSKYWKTAYKVHAFDFLEKPYDKSEMFRVLEDYITYTKEKEASIINFKVKNGMKIENTNNIYYCVFLERKTVMVSTVLGEYDAYENINDIYNKLDKEQFYMPFRDTIINLKYVAGYRLDERLGITMCDGKRFQLANGKKKEFYNILARQLRKMNRKIGGDEDEL